MKIRPKTVGLSFKSDHIARSDSTQQNSFVELSRVERCGQGLTYSNFNNRPPFKRHESSSSSRPSSLEYISMVLPVHAACSSRPNSYSTNTPTSQTNRLICVLNALYVASLHNDVMSDDETARRQPTVTR